MVVPGRTEETEYFEKRSRFISRCWRVDSRIEATERLRELKNDHPAANHIVFAFVIGDINSEELGMSDDGEPRGTSGRPTLEILKGSGIRNVLLTTIRYFGGIKLGTGGLVRAYTASARAAIENTERLLLRHLKNCSLIVAYEHYDGIKRYLSNIYCENLREVFSENVHISLSIDAEEYERLDNYLRDVTRGKASLIDRFEP